MNNFKILAISLVVVATAAFAAPKVWTGKLAEGFDGGTGKQDDPYLVSTAEQFALMAARGDSATFYKLTEDIILNEGDSPNTSLLDISMWSHPVRDSIVLSRVCENGG